MATTITIGPGGYVTVVVDDAPGLAPRVTTLEDGMEDLATRIGALQGQFDGYRDDVDAALDKLRTDLQAALNAGNLAAANDALDAFSIDIAAARSKVGDANADGDPAAPPPADDQPAAGDGSAAEDNGNADDAGDESAPGGV